MFEVTPMLLALSLLGWPNGPGWSPPGAGDDSLGGSPTTGWDDLGAGPQNKFHEAMGYFEQFDPAGAATLQAGIDSGAINVVDLDYCDTWDGDRPPARSDPGTLGLELDGNSATDLASMIAHEWGHLLGVGAAGGFGEWRTSAACAHLYASGSRLSAMCFLSCISDEAISCGSFELALLEHDQYLEDCEAQGGSAPGAGGTWCSPPGNQPTCGCDA